MERVWRLRMFARPLPMPMPKSPRVKTVNESHKLCGPLDGGPKYREGYEPGGFRVLFQQGKIILQAKCQGEGLT